ncbi:MAG: sulfatase family protein [Chitinophagaceae bacterium]
MTCLINNRFFYFLGIILFLTKCTSKVISTSDLDDASLGSSEKKPNIVYINVDDLGYGDVGAYGATKVRTPHIDKLAKEGKKFTDFHSASAVCSPSRHALLTGQYPSRKNMWMPIFLRSPLVIDTAQMTIGKIMQNAGYETAIIGKWHLGFGNNYPVDWNNELKPGPLEVGFNYFFGIPVLNSHPPFVYVENHHVVGLNSEDPLVYGKRADTRPYPEKFDLDSIGGGKAAHDIFADSLIGTTITQKAVSWIRHYKDKPFFLYFNPTNIHHPFTPHGRFIGTSEAGLYGDFIHELDWMVGEILSTLDQEGLAENTIVILTSDNGGMFNQGGQQAWRLGHRPNADLLGFKFDAWEGGHRVPFIARWPAKIPAQSQSNEMLCNIDMLATFAALTNQTLKNGVGPDSYNALPAIMGTPKDSIRDYLIISPFKKTHLAIRKGKWMYIPAQNSGGFPGTEIREHELGGAAAHILTRHVNSDIENGKVKTNAPPAQLYDLQKDPLQKQNLYNNFPQLAKQLESLLHEALSKEMTRTGYTKK